jgi:hypothetical protein
MKLLLRPFQVRTPVRMAQVSAGVRVRRARRGVIAGLATAAAAHVAVGVAVETNRPHWRDPDFGHRLPLLQSAGQSRPLVVALGSSRTQMGFRPRAMDRPDVTVINFGSAGAGPHQHFLTLSNLDAAGFRPDYVLIEIMPAALTQDAGADVAFRPQSARLSANDVARLTPYCDHPAGLWKDWALNRLNSWFSLRLNLVSHAVPGLLPWQARQDFRWRSLDRDGWLPYPFDVVPEAERRKGLARTRAEYAPTLGGFHLAQASDRILRDLIAAAHRRGIRVGLYLMPESPEYRSWYPPAARAALTDYLSTLSRECNVRVFDATDWLGEESFSDGHHLLKSGATSFSERFGRECLGPWIDARR